MSDQEKKHEKIHYVGDSRVKKDRKELKPRDYSEFPGKTEAFFPDFLLKEWMVAAVFLVGFMTLVMSEEPPLGDVADPTNTSFLPVPDWYFLFLYQLLKYKWAAGKFVVVGTMVVPGIAFTALLLVPWLDRSKERQPLKRPLTIGIMLISLIAVMALTWAAEYEHDIQLESAISMAPKNKNIIDANGEGHKIFLSNSCYKCHGKQLEGPSGPTLLGVGNKYSAEEIIEIMNKGKGGDKDKNHEGGMPPGMFQQGPEEQKLLAEWLEKQKQK